jgi:hypothetical protein
LDLVPSKIFFNEVKYFQSLVTLKINFELTIRFRVKTVK